MITATAMRPRVDAATDGLSTDTWTRIPPTLLTIATLHTTQDQVCIGCLVERCDDRLRSRDTVPHGVLLDGQVYVVDGHHRLVQDLLRGAKRAYVRVING